MWSLIVCNLVLFQIVTQPESIQLIPLIQAIANSTTRIRTHFSKETLSSENEGSNRELIDMNRLKSYLERVGACMSDSEKSDGFDLTYLRSVYDAINSRLSTTMTIKDESVEMDLITFRCTIFV